MSGYDLSCPWAVLAPHAAHREDGDLGITSPISPARPRKTRRQPPVQWLGKGSRKGA